MPRASERVALRLSAQLFFLPSSYPFALSPSNAPLFVPLHKRQSEETEERFDKLNANGENKE
jgi:hypothetical protein